MGPHRPGPNRRPWALMGRPLMGAPGLLMGCGLGPCAPPRAFMGRALVGPLWALVGWAPVGLSEPLRARPLWPPSALMVQAPIGPHEPSSARH